MGCRMGYRPGRGMPAAHRKNKGPLFVPSAASALPPRRKVRAASPPSELLLVLPAQPAAPPGHGCHHRCHLRPRHRHCHGHRHCHCHRHHRGSSGSSTQSPRAGRVPVSLSPARPRQVCQVPAVLGGVHGLTRVCGGVTVCPVTCVCVCVCRCHTCHRVCQCVTVCAPCVVCVCRCHHVCQCVTVCVQQVSHMSHVTLCHRVCTVCHVCVCTAGVTRVTHVPVCAPAVVCRAGRRHRVSHTCRNVAPAGTRV